MAMLAQQRWHTALGSIHTAGEATFRRRWQSEGAGRGKLGRRIGAVSSNFRELLPLLELHVRGGCLPVPKFPTSHGHGLAKWHWSGNVGVNHQFPRKRRAKSDDSGSSSQDETNDNDEETLGEQNDSQVSGDEEGAESQESGGEIGEVSGEEAEGESSEGSREDEGDNEISLQTEETKKGFWRKIWEPGQKDEDNTLGPEEEALLEDLENLRFEWRGLLDPSLENLLALGFTVLLTLALFKILSQLVLVVVTIVLSALKYTFLAALLLGLLIFLL